MAEEHQPNPDISGAVGNFIKQVLEATQADTAHFFTPQGQALFLRSIYQRNGQIQYENQPLSQLSELPRSLLEASWQLIRTISSQDESDHQPNVELPEAEAWLCMPLELFGSPIGLLYLEGEQLAQITSATLNQLIDGISTPHPEDVAPDQVQKDTPELAHLIAAVSHELRSPLGTVRGSVFLIANKLLGKDLGVERALDRAERNIIRCDHIIEDLLTYTRTHDLELEPVRIDRWLDNTLEEYAFPQDVTVRVKLHCGLAMELEPERLARCLINLITNACDAMKGGTTQTEDGSKVLSISTRFNQVKNRMEISVADSGSGIPEDKFKTILEPLYSTRNCGVGLGLPTVVQIIEQHGGGLEISSIVGKGTKMTLWVPIPDDPKSWQYDG